VNKAQNTVNKHYTLHCISGAYIIASTGVPAAPRLTITPVVVLPFHTRLGQLDVKGVPIPKTPRTEP